MAILTLPELQKKREQKVLAIASVLYDLREYTKYPYETVDIEQIKYQYYFLLREIKNIDEKIIQFLTTQQQNRTDVIVKVHADIDKLPKKFTSADLPKFHHSMFDEPFL